MKIVTCCSHAKLLRGVCGIIYTIIHIHGQNPADAYYMGARQSGPVSVEHETDLDQEATQLLLVWQASFKHAISVIRYVLNTAYI